MLWQRLESARLAELHKLAEIMKISEVKAKSRDVLVEELSKEIRAAAGHSFANLFRGLHDFPYKQMLIDVADKMAPGWTFLSWTGYKFNDNHSEIEIEETVWGFFEEAMKKKIASLSPEAKENLRRDTEAELLKTGYSEAIVSQIGAGLVGGAAATLIGPALAYHVALSTASGLAWAKLWWIGGASLAAVMGASTAVFAVIYIPALAWWLGSPAYRKTARATMNLIQIRKLREIEEQLR